MVGRERNSSFPTKEHVKKSGPSFLSLRAGRIAEGDPGRGPAGGEAPYHGAANAKPPRTNSPAGRRKSFALLWTDFFIRSKEGRARQPRG
jgi:hypothetical protein